MMDLSEENTGI